MPNLRGRPTRLTPEERKSLTHGDFWIPENEREIYRRALEALSLEGCPAPSLVFRAFPGAA